MPDEPNATWSADYKGWFRTGGDRRCDPLTINDGFSRCYLACTIVPPTTEGAWTVFERAFREYGLPGRIRSDNGVPFFTRVRGAEPVERVVDPAWHRHRADRSGAAPAERPTRTRPCHFEGGDERAAGGEPGRAAGPVRRLLWTTTPSSPHEALGQEPPARHYAPSQRPYPDRLLEPALVRRDHDVRSALRRRDQWRGERLFLQRVLGWPTRWDP
ncbi:MAG: hypothetical protein U5L06_14970 [Rhodovibrio sp.]|nr:hypothetical protein [Rhodovibrio sp.]